MKKAFCYSSVPKFQDGLSYLKKKLSLSYLKGGSTKFEDEYLASKIYEKGYKIQNSKDI